MKFTVVLIAALSVSASLAIKVNKEDEPKDKREAALGYPSHASHYQGSSLGHGDASAISVGAGYSVGGAKPTYSLGGHGGEGGLQLSSEGLPASGHATIQLPPITLQSGHGLESSDLSQLMAQLSHGLNSGAISLQTGESYQPAQAYQQGEHGVQQLSLPQYTFGGQNLQQYASEQPSVPSYAAGTKGLGSYSTGPVLFSPSDSQGNAPALTYGSPSAGHGGSSSGGHSFGGASNAGHSFGYVPPSSGHSFPSLSSGGHSFGGGALSLGSSGHSLPAITLGDAGHSFGGALKGFGSTYGAPSKHGAFKPSAFLGASSVQSEGHGLSGLSGSYGAPSFGSFGGSGHGLSLSSGGSGHGLSLSSGGSGHGLSLSSGGHGHSPSFGSSFGGFGGGSAKYVAASYLPAKSEGFGSSLESVASFASDGHLSSGSSHGIPSGSYLPSNNAHSASSSSPQYYVPSKSSGSGFGSGSSSYRSPYSGHSVSSFSSGPKHSFGHSHGPRYGSPKDAQGAHSETTYNTIKYSEELKPRMH